MYEINIRLINLKLMYEYIISKMVYAEVTKEMVLEARKREWNQFC